MNSGQMLKRADIKKLLYIPNDYGYALPIPQNSLFLTLNSL